MGDQTILVVDDEVDIQELVRYNLQKEGYTVHTVGTGEAALTAVEQIHPAAIVLDLMLPGIDGIQVCNRLKKQDHTQEIPVIMLTAKTEDADMVAGLEMGADDYITKPFSPKVLIARLRAVMRRTEAADTPVSGTLAVHGVTIDISRHEVYCGDTETALSATEFAILAFLMTNPGWVFSRTQIIDAVHGKDYPVTERSVDVQILGLRKKLESCGSLVETVRGVGYRFRAG
ncbi:MAG TPA: response regulator [Alkalispirochaeta sp.]|nr:response regulator [Alkalispirochaeta sp.]